MTFLTELEKDFLQAGFSEEGKTGEFCFSQWLCIMRTYFVMVQEGQVADIICDLMGRDIITASKKNRGLLKITITSKGYEVLKDYNWNECNFNQSAKEEFHKFPNHLGDIQLKNDADKLAAMKLEATPGYSKWTDDQFDYEYDKERELYLEKLEG